MSVFPKLKSGAVAQYPVQRGSSFSTSVSRFLDSSEQRFRDYRGLRRRWVVRLSQLDETELQRLSEFFVAQHGRSETFDFEDPWTGSIISGCRFEDDELMTVSDGEFAGVTEVAIVGPSS